MATAHEGDVISIDTTDRLVRASDRRLIATIGVDSIVVVDTPDATLIARKDRVQDVIGSPEGGWQPGTPVPPQGMPPVGQLRLHRHGAGSTSSASSSSRARQLSLQKHHKRAEHWIVVSGVAEVTCDERVFELRENESIYIPVGSVHRLRNNGTEPVKLLEVQSGSYLGEDDIVRLEDVRAPLIRPLRPAHRTFV